MRIIGHSARLVLAAVICAVGWGSAADADWAACQAKPTRACLSEEATRGDAGQPLTGKDRLNVLIQGGALTHPEIITPADIADAQGLAKSTPNVSSLYYVYIGIHGLIAAKQKQQAIDLIASMANPAPSLSLNAVQTLSAQELVKELVMTGDVETALAVPDKFQPPLDPKALPGTRNTVVVATIRALAEDGKPDQASKLLADQQYLTQAQIADLQGSIGTAFAKRGDNKLAQDSFDQAGKNLEASGRPATASAAMSLRFASIRLMALRGKVDEVDAALRQIGATNDAVASDQRSNYERAQSYHRIVAALLDAKQSEAALSVAKAMAPDTAKEAALVSLVYWHATNGRLADARNVLALINNASETPARVTAVRSLAVATAKQEGAAAALKAAEEIHTPLNRRPTLLAIALALPK